jgi:hypothetical protein
VGNHPPTNQAGQSDHYLDPDLSGGNSPSDRLGDHAVLAANLITIVLGVVSLVQAFRSDPLWILLGVIALTGLVVYWFHRRRWAFTVIGLVGLLTFGGGGWLLAYASNNSHPEVPPFSRRVGYLAPVGSGWMIAAVPWSAWRVCQAVSYSSGLR